jgi:DNA-binding beta-propeller fold protein YncE
MRNSQMKLPVLCGAALAGLLALSSSVQAQAPAYKVVGHVAGPDGGWDYAGFDADARRLYVAKGAFVMAVDADSGKVTPRLAPAVRAHAVVPLPGGRLMVTNGGSDTAAFFDGATGKALGSAPTAKTPDGAIYDPKSGLAFVVGHAAGGDVTFIDAASQTVTATIPAVGRTLEFAAVDGAGRLWVNDEAASEIIAIDIKARKVLAHHKLAGCEGPTGLAYAPAADRLVASCDGVAAVIDPATGAVVDTLKVGQGPDAVIYDAARKLLFVPAGESGELTVISASGPKLKVIQVVKTQIGARTGAVDPKTGKVYLPVARMAPPAVAGGRPTSTPGTFELLVVGP